jgi:hypothetical protein
LGKIVEAGDTHETLNPLFRRARAGEHAARLVLKGHAGGQKMLFTIAVILLVLWLLGMVSGYTLGNFIYVLLVIALVLFVVGLVSGRRTV